MYILNCCGLGSQNISLKNLNVPSRNSSGSKYCTLAIKSIWNLYFAAYIYYQPNIISVLCFVCKDKMLQDKAMCCSFRDHMNSSFKVWSLQTIKQKMWSTLEICSMPSFLKTYPKCTEMTCWSIYKKTWTLWVLVCWSSFYRHDARVFWNNFETFNN